MTSAPSSPSKTQTPRATAATTPPQRDPAAERVVIDVDAPYAAAPSDPMLGPAAPATSSSASTAPTPPPTDTPLASGASTSSASSSTASTVPPRASSRLAERKRTAADLAEARRQKRRLVLDKEAVAAAAVRADAIPLGPRSSSLPQPSAQQPSGAASSQPSVTPPVELSTASTPALTQPKLPRTPKTRNKPKTPKPSKTKKAKKAVPTTSPLRIPRASVASQVTAHTQPSAAPSPEAAALATSAARAPSPLLSPTIAQPQSSARGAGPISCRATPAPHTQRTRTESPDPPRSAPPPPTDAPDDSDEDIYYHAQPTATTAHAPPRQAAGAVNVDLPSASTSEPYARGGSNTHVPIPATSAFDLSRFLSQFQAGAPDNSTTSASATGTPNTAEYSSAFTALMGEFTRFLHDRQYPAGTAQTAQQLIPMFASVHSDTGSWSLPNHRNELPPVAVRNLRASDFGSPPVRARGDFIPSAVHSLAAHRLYPFLLSPEGRGTTPMAFVLRMRLLESVNFLDDPPILGATHSARFGRFGVTIMHFLRADRAAQLDAGSSDANYSLDFGANVAPPQAPSCRNYHDLLGAIQGLTTFANAEWYEPMAHVLYRLRDFATRNMDEDPDHSPELVKRTLDEVNQFLGSTFIHLSSDSPAWWRDFCASAQRITFTSPSWAIALSTTRRAPAAAIHSSPPARVVSAQRQVTSGGGENPQPRPSAIPQKYRAMIPRNADGQEPCLRFFAGSMCYGGTTATCGSRSRVHSWPEDLPPALIEYIKKRFGRRDTGNRRRS